MLIKNIDEQSYHARADRRFAQAQVIAVDPVMHTCTLDAGARDTAGNAVYLQGVAFSPQTPPSPGDMVSLQYCNASPHSMVVTGGQLGGQNPQSSLRTVGSVSSIAAGGSAPLAGAVQLAAGSGIALSQSAQTITISAGGGTGVSGISVNGGTAAAGSINFAAGSGVVLTQNGQTITIAAAPAAGNGAWPVTVWTPKVSPAVYNIPAAVQMPFVLVANNVPAGATVNLPSGSAGGPIVLKNYSSNGLTAVPSGSDTIQGSSSWTFNPTGELVLIPAELTAGAYTWLIISLG